MRHTRILAAVLVKRAGIGSSIIKFLENNPGVEKGIRNASNYRLMDPRNRWKNMLAGSGMGAVSGAGAGATIKVPEHEDGTPDRLTGSLRGGLAGLMGGAAFGRYAPRIAQKTLGRVLTNTLLPVGYDPANHRYLKSQGLKDRIMAVLTDTPLNPADDRYPNIAGRDELFRDYFGMKPRLKTQEGIFNQIGVDEAGNKIKEINSANPKGSELLADVAEKVRSSFHGADTDPREPARKMQLGKDTLVTSGPMANFHVKPTGEWEDKWDFGLNGKIEEPTDLLRALVSPFGSPTTVRGKTLSHSDVLNTSKMVPEEFETIHPSFLEPLAKRLSEEKSPTIDYVNLLRQAGRDKTHHGDVMQALSATQDGRSYDTEKLHTTLTKFMRPEERATLPTAPSEPGFIFARLQEHLRGNSDSPGIVDQFGNPYR